MCLTVEQINIIEEEVDASGVAFSHLADDLVDHICCDVEQKIINGESFELAFEKVKEQIGIGGLKRIEEQTILLINQNYIVMKKSMKILAVIIVSAFCLGASFKTVHLPGASLLMLISMVLLMGGYIPLLFLSRNKEDTERKQVSINLVGYVACTLFVVDMLFILYHWPYGESVRMLFWLSALMFLIVYLKNIIKKENNAEKATRVGIIVIVAVLLAFDMILFFQKYNADYVKYEVVATNLDEQTAMNSFYVEEAYATFYRDTLLNEKNKKEMERIKVLFEETRNSLLSLKDEIEQKNDFNSIRFKDHLIDGYDDKIFAIKQNVDNLKQTIISTCADSLIVRYTQTTLETNKIGHSFAGQLLFERPLLVVRNNLNKINNDLLFLEHAVVTDMLKVK